MLNAKKIKNKPIRKLKHPVASIINISVLNEGLFDMVIVNSFEIIFFFLRKKIFE
jgi:hypothetical protein